MIDKELLSRKMSQLRSYVHELRQAEDITWSKYQLDTRAKAFVERYLYLAIEKVIDISNHLVSFYKWREPEGYRNLFPILSKHGVIQERYLEDFQNMASFRNMLGHSYEQIDDNFVFGIFQNRIGDFERFIDSIIKWLEEQPKG